MRHIEKNESWNKQQPFKNVQIKKPNRITTWLFGAYTLQTMKNYEKIMPQI